MYFHEITSNEIPHKYNDRFNSRGILSEFMKSNIPLAQLDQEAFTGKVGPNSLALNLREWVKRLNYPIKVVVRKPNVYLINTKLAKNIDL